MAQTINIQAPTLAFGGFGIASCQVDIIENGTPISTRYYYFPVGQFSSIADSVAANYASLHFGKHTLDVNNGQFSTFIYGGASQASAYALVLAVSQDVAALV